MFASARCSRTTVQAFCIMSNDIRLEKQPVLTMSPQTTINYYRRYHYYSIKLIDRVIILLRTMHNILGSTRHFKTKLFLAFKTIIIQENNMLRCVLLLYQTKLYDIIYCLQQFTVFLLKILKTCQTSFIPKNVSLVNDQKITLYRKQKSTICTRH